MNTQLNLKRIALTGVAGLLLVAACTPAGTVGTPLATAVVSSPEPTIATTVEVVETIEPTEDVSTAVATTEATTAATAAVTAEATEMPALTGTPAADEERPSVLLSTELIGSQIVDDTGAEVGMVEELLVDNAGVVQYVIFDATQFLDDRSTEATPAATPAADATQSPLNEGYVAAPLNAFVVNEVTDDEARVLRYTGTADTLRGMTGFNTALLDADGFLVDTADSDLAADITYDGLIRVSRFTDFDLRNAEGDDLGEVEDLIVDVDAGQVTYGVVDFGGFLGIAEQTTAVPWTMFTVQETAGATPTFMLEVNSDLLENAPVIDLGAWPTWSERIEGLGEWMTDWDAQIRTFWESAASS